MWRGTSVAVVRLTVGVGCKRVYLTLRQRMNERLLMGKVWVRYARGVYDILAGWFLLKERGRIA